MKTSILCFLAGCLLVFTSATAQPTWKKISPTTWNVPFELLQKGPGNRLLALGRQDKNVVTLDGVTWKNTVMNVGVNDLPWFATYASENVVFAGFRDMDTFEPTVLRKSTDGGKTWVVADNSHKICELSYVPGSQTGYAICGIPFQSQTIKKTTDGGATWTTASNVTSSTFGRILAIGENEVWASDIHLLKKSTDGGVTWSTVNVGSANYIRHLTLDGQFGYTYSDTEVFTTTDGGSTWTALALPSFVSKAYFLDAQTGWVRGNQLYKTVNGGTAWQPLGNENLIYSDKNMYFNAQDHGWNVRAQGIGYTTNGGQTWKNPVKITGENLTEAEFQGTRCWVGKNELLYSDDKCKTWTRSPLMDSLKTVQEIKFRDSLNGVMVGESKVYTTSNGGATWQGRALPSALVFNARFLNESTGVVWGPRKVFVTNNGGQSWMESTMPSAPVGGSGAGTAPIDVQFVSPSVGFMGVSIIDIGGGGPNPPPFEVGMNFLYKTADGGASWQRMDGFTPGFYTLIGLEFADAQHGVVRNYSTSLRYTGDGGSSFSDVPLGNTPGVLARKVQFVNDTMGFALLRKQGRMYKTTNAGASWAYYGMIDSLNVDSLEPIQAIAYQGLAPVLAAGGGGVIYSALEWSGLKAYRATGRIVKKENNDCVQDANEIPLPNRVVRSEPWLYYTSTDANGNYTVLVDTGSGFIRELIPNFLPVPLETQYCPPGNAPHSLVVTEADDTLENNNFINDARLCPVLVLDQTHLGGRTCTKSMLQITIRNYGNINSDSEWVHVKLPPQLVFLSASQFSDYNALDSTYRFRIPPIQPNGIYTINLQDSVVCNQNNTGLHVCIQTILPNAPACLLSSPGWDGANLEVASKCVAGQAKFIIHNKGAAMNTTSQYRIFVDATLAYQAPFQLGANGQMTVAIPPGTAGNIRLEVSQTAHHPLSTFAAAEANCGTGESTNGVFPPSDESPLVDVECILILNSFDPNDKTVFPTGWGTAGNVEPETEFKYTIRFQNTGNDTAYKVVLIDTLDNNLDVASLQIGNASHAYEFKVTGKGRAVLSWTFNNILLPDSGANQLASNGFVSYSIRPKTGLALGTRLENYADIYFDFNDPVRTNTTVNTLWRPTYTPGVLDTVFVTAAKESVAMSGIAIYPNPAKDKLEVNSPHSGRLHLYNLQGQLVASRGLEPGKNLLQLAHLPKGLYLVQIQLPDEQVCKKIILE